VLRRVSTLGGQCSRPCWPGGMGKPVSRGSSGGNATEQQASEPGVDTVLGVVSCSLSRPTDRSVALQLRRSAMLIGLADDGS
jgi:hypothetical protein